VSLEQRPSEVTRRADVVLPVAAVVEKAGTFLNWEGRARPFEAALKPDQMTRRHLLPDARVLHMLADAMSVADDAVPGLALPDVRAVRAELDRLGGWDGPRATAGLLAGTEARALPRPGSGEAVLAGHRLLLDQGRMQEGDPALAGTRHAAVARMSAATAAEAGLKDGAEVEVTGPHGAVTFPLQVSEMPDRVVWLPLNSQGGGVAHDTGANPGDLVTVAAKTAGPAAPADGTEVAE
ncbi:NADH-quinone oxidoreductase subunit G, partial [Streptomyces sp. Ru73]|uniref:molybdopterin dinucleotide binding domain-containing protein n=1 Tax=Streptomyces sp. Ru73 TaxID=2080748 RepID=UPI000D3FFD3B